MPLWVIAVAIAAIDQAIKYYVQSHMELGYSIAVIPEVFHITYILNPGAAFGLLEYQTKFFVLVAGCMLIAFLYFYKEIADSPWTSRLGFCFLAGGATGNLIDRIQTGYVVDYLDFRVWPVFNAADIAIIAGTAGLVYTLLFVPEAFPAARLKQEAEDVTDAENEKN